MSARSLECNARFVSAAISLLCGDVHLNGAAVARVEQWSPLSSGHSAAGLTSFQSGL